MIQLHLLSTTIKAPYTTLYTPIYPGLCFSNQERETLKISTNKLMGNENLAYLHNKIFLLLKNETIKFTGNWMELEKIILSEVT